MKRLCSLLALSALLLFDATSQELIFMAPGGKQGRLKISSGKVEKNEFSMVLMVEWLDTKMRPVEDKNSFIVFNKNEVALPGMGGITCKTFTESSTSIFYFNQSLHLTFSIKEDLTLANQAHCIDFNFRFASGVESTLTPSHWVNFLAKSPRNFVVQFVIAEGDVKDLTPPKITILSPEGVMEGFRPLVYDKELEVKVKTTDRSSIAEVSINNVRAVPLSDSTYIASIQFTRMGGTYPVKVTALDKYGNSGQTDFFVETKQGQDHSINPLAEIKKSDIVSDVDTLIPLNKIIYETRYALIIGNEDYKSHQKGLNYESNVEFARRDAEIFKEYAQKALGIKESNILFLKDAKAVEMHRGINQLAALLKATRGKGEAIVFFAGHGFPNEKTREGYIVPVDVSGTDLEFAIKLKDLYAKLAEHPSQGVTIFLDACFSGGGREQGLLAARAVRVRPKEEAIAGNIVVLSASGGNESALPFRSKFHGMFTYYLLKAIQESQGDISLGELADYISSKVSTSSILHNNKEQNPTVSSSFQLGDGWKNWRLNK